MTLYLAGDLAPTTVRLLEAARLLELDAALAPIEDVAARARPGDVVLPRLDVLQTLDGVQPGLGTLAVLERRGVRVLNGGGALLAAHDKLATAIALARSAVPHPVTAHTDLRSPCTVAFPVVVKPRFGSWGRDVLRCESRRELAACRRRVRGRQWFARQGALVQELVPPRGHDLRIIVAGGAVVGAARRIAAEGEWRTNIALGGYREPTIPPPDAEMLARQAAAAIGADLVGVDLLPTEASWTVLELNGCVDFTQEYGLLGGDPFIASMLALERLTQSHATRVLATISD